MDNISNRYDIEKIRIESVTTLINHGVSKEDANLLVDSMLEADMAGISSHGIRMLPAYIDKVEKGYFSFDKPEVLKATPAFALVDSKNTMGQISAVFCSELAVSKAKETGIYTVFARNCNTFGAASFYVNRMAECGMIGIAISNSPAAMPVANGAEPMLGTNPIAFACPAKTNGPILFDMASSIVAKSKLEMFRQEGKELPDGWALDSEGNPTNNPVAGIEGLVLPMAGFKGYGIAMMIDIIAGVLSGASYLKNVNKFYSPTDSPMNVGQTFIAIDPTVVYGPNFLELMDEYVDRVRASKTVKGKEIIVPGDRRKGEKRAAQQRGISLSTDSATRLAKVLISGSATDIDFSKIFGGTK